MFSQFCSLVIIRTHYVLFGALPTPWKSYYALLRALGPPSDYPVILLIGLMISDLLPYPVSRGLPTPGPYLHLVQLVTRDINILLPLLCPYDAILVSALLLADITIKL